MADENALENADDSDGEKQRPESAVLEPLTDPLRPAPPPTVGVGVDPDRARPAGCDDPTRSDSDRPRLGPAPAISGDSGECDRLSPVSLSDDEKTGSGDRDRDRDRDSDVSPSTLPACLVRRCLARRGCGDRDADSVVVLPLAVATETETGDRDDDRAENIGGVEPIELALPNPSSTAGTDSVLSDIDRMVSWEGKMARPVTVSPGTTA